MSGVTHCAHAAEVSANFAPNDPPGEWHSQARDYANTRFSPLDEINFENVKQLRIAWSFSDGVNYGHEGAPLVIGSHSGRRRGPLSGVDLPPERWP
jgi:glucose dehydrogenase